MGHLPFQGQVITGLNVSPRALIVKPSSLGDIVHGLAFLSAFKRRFPGAAVQWVVFRGLEGLLEGHPMIERLVVLDRDALRSPISAARTAMKLRSELRAQEFDIAIDLQGLFRSGMITYLSNAPVRAGFSDARELSPLFYNLKVRGGTGIHAVDRYLKIAEMLGCATSPVEFPMVYDDCAPPFEGDYAVLVPGARWQTKLWPAGSFGRLASMMPIRSVVAGGRSDVQAGDTIASLSKGRAVNMAGSTSLRELAGLIRGARYVVTNDTGPMHIAAALGVPVFAIFGPTSPVSTGPYGSNHTIISSGLPCAPCYRRKCPDLRCMEGVSPEMVLEAIQARNL